MTVDKLTMKQCAHIIDCGGWLGLREADDENNNLSRDIIKAFKEENEHCYMGKITLDGQKRRDIIDGKISCYEEYTGQRIYNFGCDFIIPEADDKLTQMIKEWNTDWKLNQLEEIQKRIDELQGIYIIWS